jgi:hypothetical protein
MTRPSANARRLAKLLREAREAWFRASGPERTPGEDAFIAAFLAKRGGLAVCKATVPDHELARLSSYYNLEPKRALLRRLARGK